MPVLPELRRERVQVFITLLIFLTETVLAVLVCPTETVFTALVFLTETVLTVLVCPTETVFTALVFLTGTVLTVLLFCTETVLILLYRHFLLKLFLTVFVISD